ncbi:DUF445 domain-containing protein [Acetobacterium carbinolicum]|jgi:uncharacterized membrane protein YheB (UPF0754 family)|uniref:DUF445 domain-containing protein n=1 Tax=Acetobacterium TaxID=33951 RepID=UPI000DBEB5A1|nr:MULTISPECIES: DUF445 family protein [unclassified Acetobacterium]AWW25613.1 hypothetical protein DOZ58_02530 [Acetobacterium sp. KB-1]MDZ5724559.1 DUF445 family protein [Acetobacterium sp. K1/6]
MNLSFFIGPILGGIIGLITNGIAIRMLFRPLEAIKVFGLTLPFTPGLIPKEKPRIAKSLGNVVANNLLNENVIKNGLLSKEVDDKIANAVNGLIAKKSTSEETLRELFYSFSGDQRGEQIITEVSTKIVDFSYERMVKMELGPLLSEIAVTEIVSNLQGSMFAMLINGNLISSAKVKMSEIIERMVVEKGEGILGNIIEKEGNNLLGKRLCDLYNEYEDRIPEFVTWIISSYHQLIEKNIGSLINALNLSKLVEDQINGYDVLTFEKMILEIMHKELSAIVWLGGLLGCIMGLVMSFV